MNLLRFFVCFFSLSAPIYLSSAEFTLGSYNCGGLSDHYDYLRAAAMQKIMQERYVAEPDQMSLNERVQKLALKVLFSSDSEEKDSASKEQQKLREAFDQLTSSSSDANSPNEPWYKKAEETITSYKIRPVVIHDEEVKKRIQDHISDLTKGGSGDFQNLHEVRNLMAKRIFENQMKFDILCLQEADYLDASLFPSKYKVLFSDNDHSKNGIAFNQDRFELIDEIGDVLERAFIVQLMDKETGKTLLVVSAHLTGCNPYQAQMDLGTGISDSATGDNELQTTMDVLEKYGSDLMIIGMDSNVTSLHPRMTILKNGDFKLDYENFIEPTCTNPNLVLNTRIDWIAIKSLDTNAKIKNIPVNIPLNNIQMNISDHMPIASKISYM